MCRRHVALAPPPIEAGPDEIKVRQAGHAAFTPYTELSSRLDLDRDIFITTISVSIFANLCSLCSSLCLP